MIEILEENGATTYCSDILYDKLFFMRSRIDMVANIIRILAEFPLIMVCVILISGWQKLVCKGRKKQPLKC